MQDLKGQKCVACQKDAPAATLDEIGSFQSQSSDWQVVEVNGVPRLQREYSFPDFLSALDFANKVGAVAEAENHHPLISIAWGKVLLAWWTHKIKNIHRNDLIMAAKSDAIFGETEHERRNS